MRITKRFLYIFLSLIILFLPCLQLQGQIQCLPARGIQDAPYWRSTFVFAGRVEKISAENDNLPSTEDLKNITVSTEKLQSRVIRFEVEKVYRGAGGKNIEIVSSQYFVEGEKYFVYAFAGKDESRHRLTGEYCGSSPTLLLKDAKEDLEYAEDIAAGKPGIRIEGIVNHDLQNSIREQRRQVPLAGIEVSIKSGINVFKTKTGENGKYVFRDIPTGTYKVTASIPKGMHERTIGNSAFFEDDFKPHTVVVGETFLPDLNLLNSPNVPKKVFYHRAFDNFLFSSLSDISGKIVDYQNKLPPQQFLWLMPVDEAGKTILDSPVAHLWMDSTNGEFVFRDIPPGQYRIVVNRYNCHIDRTPEYARNYYPGAANEEDAGIITVGENHNLQLKNFRLAKPLKERWISGIVLAADKSPLAGATVYLRNLTDFKGLNECLSSNGEIISDQSGHFRAKVYESYQYQIGAYIETKAQNQKNSRLYSKGAEIGPSGNVENLQLIVNSPN